MAIQIVRLVRSVAPSFVYGSPGLDRTSNPMDIDGGPSSTLIAKVIGTAGPAPDTVVRDDTAAALTKIAESPNGRASWWALPSAAAGTAVTVTATWGTSQGGRSIQIGELGNMPPTLEILDTGSFDIASGTLATIPGMSNAGTGSTGSCAMLMCCESDASNASMIWRKYLSRWRFRGFGDPSDDFAQGALYLPTSEFFSTDIEAVFPNTTSFKEGCAVVLNGGVSEAPDLSRGAEWIAGGAEVWQNVTTGTDIGGLGTGGVMVPALLGSNDGYRTYIADAGIVDRLAVRVRANNLAAGGQFTLYLFGGGELSSAVGIPGSGDDPSTGWFYADPTLFDYVAGGSYLQVQWSNFINPGGGDVTFDAIAFRFTSADGTKTYTRLITKGNDLVGPGAPYIGVVGPQRFVSEGDKAVNEFYIGKPCIAKNLAFFCNDNNGRSVTASIYLQVNGVDSALKVDLPAGGTGWFTSGALEAALTDDPALPDYIYYRAEFGADSTGFNVNCIQMDLVSDDDRWWFGGVGQQGRSLNLTTDTFADYPLGGANDVPVVAVCDTLVTAPLRFQFLGITITDNDCTTDSTLELYVNGVATGFVITIPAGEIGSFRGNGLVPLTIDNATFDQAFVRLTRGDVSGDGALVYSMMYWAGRGVAPEAVTPGIIGELAWIHRTRRIPSTGEIVRETYSDADMHCPPDYQNGFKAGRVLQFSEAERVASDPVRGEWRGSTWTVRYSDKDRHFREQSINATDRYAQDGQGLMTTRENRAVKGEPFTIFTGGFVSGRPVSGLQWEETYSDAIGTHKRANQTDLLPWRVIGDSFIMNPDEFSVVADGLDLMTPEPIIYGRHIRVPDVDVASEQGFVFPPIYLGIETIEGVDKHVWMIAGHACAAITDLRVDLTEVFSDPEWEIPGIGGFPKYEDRRSVTFGNMRRYSLLRAPVTDLTADEASLTNPDACALRVKQLTVAVEGIEPNGDGSGEVILDRLLAYLHYEQNFGQRKGQDSYQAGAWLPTPTWIIFDETTPMIDEDSYRDCSAIALERFPGDGYIVAGILGARAGDRRPRADWKATWNRSCSTRSGPTNLGADRVFMLHPTAAIKAAAPLYTDATEILDGTFEPDIAWDQQQTRLTFVCDPRHDSGQWATTDTITEQAAIENYGNRDIPGETREYDFAPGITQATHLGLIELRRIAHPPRPVTLAAKVRPDYTGDSLGHRQVGDYVRYRHVESIGTSKAQIRLMQIDRIRISPSGRYVIAQGVDVEDYIDYDAPGEALDASTNDTCADAIEIDPTPSTPYTRTLDTTAAPEDTSIESELPDGYKAYHAAWWTVTPDVDGARLFLSTVFSNYDTILAVFTGSCGSLTRVQFNDNDGFRTTSVLDFEVANGTTYYILAAGFGPDDGGSLTFSAQVYVPS